MLESEEVRDYTHYPLLQIQNLCLKISEYFSLQEVSLELKAQKILAIVGESGSGKSMLAQHILGLVKIPKGAVSGRVLFEGRDLSTLDSKAWNAFRGKEIAYIPQEPLSALNPLHNIGAQIAESYILHNPKVSKSVLHKIVCECMQSVGLEENLLTRYPHTLSGGQRQRALIAMSIINKPKILICDEPTTALDILIQKQILTLLQSLSTQSAIILITHDLGAVAHIADEIVIMSQGRIIESNSTQMIFTNPKHTYTKNLLDALDFHTLTPNAYESREVLRLENFSAVALERKFLRTKHITITHNVSFSLYKGEILGIAGESGSGKSSLGMAIIRLMEHSGEIEFFGKKSKDFSRQEYFTLCQKINIVFQDPFASLNPRMRIGEIIAEGLRVHKVYAHRANQKECIYEKVKETLQSVGLDESFTSRYPHTLSGGQRQRVAIARALVLEPSILLLDEPTSALDKSTQKQILELLLKLQKKFGLSLIFITHDLEILRFMSHSIIVLKDGYIEESGVSSKVFAEPKSVYFTKLLEAHK